MCFNSVLSKARVRKALRGNIHHSRYPRMHNSALVALADIRSHVCAAFDV